MSDLKPDCDAALDFLRKVSRRVHLVAINPKKRGQIEGELFLQKGQERLDAIRDFIEKWNAHKHWNVYFTTGRVRRNFKGDKSKDTDIEVVTMFKVDLDPAKVIPDGWDPREFVEHQRGRIHASLTTEVPEGVPGPPTLVLDSGGGMWGLWLLGVEYDIEDEEERPQLVARNKHLIELYRAHFRDGGVIADGVADLGRICRLPGTVNWQDEDKLKGGRWVQLAAVDEGATDLDRRYAPNQFDPPNGVGSARPSIGTTVEIDTANVERFASVDDIEELRDDSDARNAKCRVCIVQGTDPDEPFVSRSEPLHFVCCQMVRAECSDDAIYSVITDPAFGISASVLDKGSGIESYAERQIRRAKEEVEAESAELVLDPSDPLPSAESFVAREAPELMLYNGDWLDYDGAAYREVEDGIIESRVYRFLQRAKKLQRKGKGWEEVPFKPNSARVSDVMRALRSVAIRARDEFEPPCWIGEPGPPPREVISCSNGLLHLPTGELHPPTPRFFTRNALAIAYDPGAPEPAGWQRFLLDLWASDPDSIRVLQEVFGYLLVPDTSQQKLFFLKGPPRSGKGTIARVLRELVGAENACSPSLPSLGTPFGLEPLAGRSLAIVSDARDSGRMEVQASIAENLLRITGEDAVSVHRKFKTALDLTLSVRFLIMSNLRPKLPDASGALGNRFVPIVMTESFLGQEDSGLTTRLLGELPGILNWAIDGWRRLRERGYFEPSATGRALLVDLVEDASPIMSFVREECELDPMHEVPKHELYEAYREWRLMQGMNLVDARVFGKDMQAAFPKVEEQRPRIDGVRVRIYAGIALAGTEVGRARRFLEAWAHAPSVTFGREHERAFERLWGEEETYGGGAWDPGTSW